MCFISILLCKFDTVSKPLQQCYTKQGDGESETESESRDGVKEGDMRMRASTQSDGDTQLGEEKANRRAEGYWIAPVSSRNDFSMTPGM